MTLKYDSWHKEVLSKFGSMLGNEMAEFHTQVSKVGAATRLLGFLCACFYNHDLPDCEAVDQCSHGDMLLIVQHSGCHS